MILRFVSTQAAMTPFYLLIIFAPMWVALIYAGLALAVLLPLGLLMESRIRRLENEGHRFRHT